MRTRIAPRILVALLALTASASRAEEKTAPPQKLYDSPQEVIEAYRKAVAAHDWRAMYFCMTPQRREDQIFEAAFACGMQENQPEVRALLKKYGFIESTALTKEYNKRYKQKHGIDLDQFEAEQEKRRKQAADKALAERAKRGEPKPSDDELIAVPVTEEHPATPPPHDDALLRQLISEQIPDKPTFFAEAASALTALDAKMKTYAKAEDGIPEQPPPARERIDRIQITGDKATVRVVHVLYHLERSPGQPYRWVGTNIDSIRHFGKMNGGWLIGNDETSMKGPPVIIQGR